jgi:periplasmic protein TonB
MTLAPYYRLYELPWSPTEEVERRYRVTLRNSIIVFAIIALVIAFVPSPEKPKQTTAELPDRVLKMVIEKKLPPPPPPPKEEEKKPEEKKPEPKPQEKPKEDAQKQAKKELKVFDQFEALRDSAVLDKAQNSKDLLANANEQTRSERNLLTSKVGAGSGGINSASLSRGYGGATGALKGGDTTKISSNLGSGDGRPQVTRTSGSGKSARSREEVELTFDRNKGAITQIYYRALRDNPDLKGKVVFEITIAPSGDVSNCVVLSSELNDPELERKLIARIKLFKFEPRDVESLKLTKPIDFFPAG